jgi:hypothetical protein
MVGIMPVMFVLMPYSKALRHRKPSGHVSTVVLLPGVVIPSRVLLASARRQRPNAPKMHGARADTANFEGEPCTAPLSWAQPPPTRPHSSAPRLQVSVKHELRTRVRTAHATKMCQAHPNVYRERKILTPPCIPTPAASPASCSPQISFTAKSVRPAGSAPRHRPPIQSEDHGCKMSVSDSTKLTPKESGLSRSPPPNSHLQLRSEKWC